MKLPDGPEYKSLFSETGDRLASLATTLSKKLATDDVCGLFIGVGIAGWLKNKSQGEVAGFLREYADILDAQQTKRKLN